MPLLYLAKVNLNSQIFDVYEKKITIEEVTQYIYENLSSSSHYENSKKEKYINSYGNEEIYIKSSKYSFQEINKNDNGIITGKLVRTFNKPTEVLDEKIDKMVLNYIEESVSIYFYYDVYKEMVTFCERQTFGYNQFMDAFTQILNKSVGIYEFEMFLQKDKDLLEDKMKTFKNVQRVKATLIPPNSDEEDLQVLRDELLYMQQCQEANATKMNLEYSSENMKMESKVMKDIMTAVSRGYGDVTATGINQNGRTQTISSSQDAAYTSNIQENISVEEYNKESSDLIVRFLGKIAINLFG